MSAPRHGLSGIPKCLSYNRPTVTKLTPEDARDILESKVVPGDKQAQKLREAIMAELDKHD